MELIQGIAKRFFREEASDISGEELVVAVQTFLFDQAVTRAEMQQMRKELASVRYAIDSDLIDFALDINSDSTSAIVLAAVSHMTRRLNDAMNRAERVAVMHSVVGGMKFAPAVLSHIDG